MDITVMDITLHLTLWKLKIVIKVEITVMDITLHITSLKLKIEIKLEITVMEVWKLKMDLN